MESLASDGQGRLLSLARSYSIVVERLRSYNSLLVNAGHSGTKALSVRSLAQSFDQLTLENQDFKLYLEAFIHGENQRLDDQSEEQSTNTLEMYSLVEALEAEYDLRQHTLDILNNVVRKLIDSSEKEEEYVAQISPKLVPFLEAQGYAWSSMPFLEQYLNDLDRTETQKFHCKT
eukprot:g3784.t1